MILESNGLEDQAVYHGWSLLLLLHCSDMCNQFPAVPDLSESGRRIWKLPSQIIPFEEKARITSDQECNRRKSDSEVSSQMTFVDNWSFKFSQTISVPTYCFVLNLLTLASTISSTRLQVEKANVLSKSTAHNFLTIHVLTTFWGKLWS